MSRRAAAVLLLTTCTSFAAMPPAHAQPVVADGFSIRTVATGLDGPQGMALVGSGQAAVIENSDVPGIGTPSRLKLVRPNGTARVLASAPAGVGWVDLVLDPSRGFLAVGVRDFRVSPAEGIHVVHHNGDVAVLAPLRAHVLGIALDPRTGDIYFSQIVPGQLPSIARLSSDGAVSIFRRATRAAGLAIDPAGRLVAAVQWRHVDGVQVMNEVVAYDLVSGAEDVLATGVGSRVGSVAVSPPGEVFVSDYEDGTVKRLFRESSGRYSVTPFVWGLSTESRRFPDAPPREGLSFNSVAFDRAGRLYISDYAAGRIYVVNGPF